MKKYMGNSAIQEDECVDLTIAIKHRGIFKFAVPC